MIKFQHQISKCFNSNPFSKEPNHATMKADLEWLTQIF